MAIALRAKSTGDLHFIAASGGTFAITKPAGTVATDILVVTATSSYTGSPNITAPSGWTLIAGNIGNTSMQGWAWWAPGSVANLTFTRSNTINTNDVGWVCDAWTGVDNTTPIDATGSTATSTGSTSVTAPAVTTVTDQSLEVIATPVWNSATLSATGFSVSDNSPVTNQQAGFVYANTAKSPAGSTGTVAVSVSGSATGQILAAIPFALRPVSGGTPAFVAAPPLIIRQAVKRSSLF